MYSMCKTYQVAKTNKIQLHAAQPHDMCQAHRVWSLLFGGTLVRTHLVWVNPLSVLSVTVI